MSVTDSLLCGCIILSADVAHLSVLTQHYSPAVCYPKYLEFMHCIEIHTNAKSRAQWQKGRKNGGMVQRRVNAQIETKHTETHKEHTYTDVLLIKITLKPHSVCINLWSHYSFFITNAKLHFTLQLYLTIVYCMHISLKIGAVRGYLNILRKTCATIKIFYTNNLWNVFLFIHISFLVQ